MTNDYRWMITGYKWMMNDERWKINNKQWMMNDEQAEVQLNVLQIDDNKIDPKTPLRVLWKAEINTDDTHADNETDNNYALSLE